LRGLANIHNRVTISTLDFREGQGEGTVRLFGFGFLIVWLLASVPTAITVAETVRGPDATQSLPQPIPALQDDDLLNILD
jgi:hypothetical protein